MLFLGIDSGTQSTKTVVLDFETGAIIAHSSAKYDVIDGLPPGHMEQHPSTWTKAVDETIASCLEQIGARRDEVRGIGVSGQQHGLVALDAKDQPVRAAKLWCDTSTTAECEALAAAFGGPAGLIGRAGNAVPPGFTAPKILWLKNHEPDNFAKTASVLLPHDYINFHLTGVKRMEYGDASGTGLLNIRTRQWQREFIDLIDPRVHDMLPPLGSSLARHGELREDLRQRWGLPAGVVVSAGGGDNMMGAIGTGNVQPGVVTVSLGTSGTLFACSDKPVIDPMGEVAAFCDSADQWMPLVCTMNVTVLTEQVREVFGWEIPKLEEHLTRAPAGADGLVFLPYLNGERTPNLPAGTGVLYGLRTDNMTPAHIARAAVEGVTVGLAYGMTRFKDLGLTPSEIRLTGGGSRSAAWRQIVADVFGVPVVTLSTAEGAGLGAAVQAAYVSLTESGKGVSMGDLTARLVQLDDSTRCAPDAGRHALYAGQLTRQMDLTRALKSAGWL
ncbi:MAG TPA: xylulokinase [Verrucomicrobiales bacterium]|nr:xylulokinase [Verrucomicrobiales bacterium]